ncbi:TPA: glutamine amidotransferase [Candidatus Saccharibacteria bacterium]|nr:MAG: hypothetical protein A3F05_03625 [Candidatus Saccharibacteria bacterium RIFCSPHIGHO2_12_FULL_47_17]HCM51805.1 glutamine amidotransferase [Candidatus Saccharibacteria bacterium]
MKVHIIHLYPKEMNIYGDTGNRLVLSQRLKWRGYEPIVHLVGLGDKLPAETDIILGGGGQDSGQALVIDDLAKRQAELNAMADDGVTMLMICGMYQLFGHYFLTQDGDKLPGISVFNLVTRGSNQRLIGNIVSETPFGQLVGYENHSGLTELAKGLAALGKCPKGQGNNGADQNEGATVQNVFGSYLHGPILSKNPHFADELITRTIERKSGQKVQLTPLSDELELAAANVAKSRPR